MWVGELPSGQVTGLAFSPDAGVLYTGNTHGLLLAWDRGTATPRQLLQLPIVSGTWSAVDRILPDPEGRWVRVPTRGRLDTLDPRTGRPVSPEWEAPRDPGLLDPRYSVVVTSSAGNLVLASGWDSNIVCDLTTRAELRVPRCLVDCRYIYQAEFSPDGRFLAVCAREVDVDFIAGVWDVELGTFRPLPLPAGEHLSRIGITDKLVYAIAPDRRHVRLFGLPDLGGEQQIDCGRNVEGVALDPAGRLVATVDGRDTVTLRDVATGHRLREYRWPASKLDVVAFAPDGLTCAAGGFKQFVVFDVDL
jgi:WD40 repeat protein